MEKSKQNNMNQNNSFLLPKILHKSFSNTPFSLQLKAKFLYYLNISIITITLIVIIFDALIQNMGQLNTNYFIVSVGQVLLLILMGGSLWLLLKGWYYTAANLLLSSIFIALWFIYNATFGIIKTLIFNSYLFRF